jgi:hypothetical protein
LQALTLLNHSFVIDMAGALAQRLPTASPVEAAYRFVFQRRPHATERQLAEQFISSHGLRAFCRALLNANELIYLE